MLHVLAELDEQHVLDVKVTECEQRYELHDGQEVPDEEHRGSTDEHE